MQKSNITTEGNKGAAKGALVGGLIGGAVFKCGLFLPFCSNFDNSLYFVRETNSFGTHFIL